MSRYNAPFEIHVHGDVPLRPDVTYAQLQDALKPLWTYAGDKKPGDMNGHDHYDPIFNDQKVPTRVVDIGTPQDGIRALFWAVALP